MSDKKIYYFDFGNTFKKVLSYFIMIVALAGFYMIINFAEVHLFFYIKGRITNEELVNTIHKFLVCIILIFEAYGLIIQFLPKRIILTDKGIKIRKNNLDGKTIFPFNNYIKYQSIKVCRINHSEYKHSRYLRITFPFCNRESLVMIKTKFGKYFVPVENAEDFVKEVNKRIQLVNEKK